MRSKRVKSYHLKKYKQKKMAREVTEMEVNKDHYQEGESSVTSPRGLDCHLPARS